jgi:branched-chain amino acid transport system permease protein
VVTDRYWMHLLILMCIWSIAAASLNLIMGYAGQANLALGAFFGIGSYTTALLMIEGKLGFWLALLLSGLFSALVGFLIGLPTLRTKGSYFAIGTLCFNVIVFIAVERWESLTGGARGILGIPPPASLALPGLPPISFKSLPAMYYLVLTFLAATLLVVRRLVHSPIGRSFVAVRESEDLTSSLGIDPMRTKIAAFVVSTFLASVAGGLYAVYIGFLDPEVTSYHVTFEVLLFVVVGGIGTLAGPVVGAILVTLLGESLHLLDAYRLVAYGLVLVLVIIFMPQGIVGAARRVLLTWSRRSGAPVEAKESYARDA